MAVRMRVRRSDGRGGDDRVARHYSFNRTPARNDGPGVW